jgi:hypothetical protein
MHFPVGVDADRVRLLLGDRGGMRCDVGHDQSQGGNATGQCPIDEGVSGYSHFGSFASLAGLFQFVKRFLVERTRVPLLLTHRQVELWFVLVLFGFFHSQFLHLVLHSRSGSPKHVRRKRVGINFVLDIRW